ncbi:MAG: hypothetical protein E3J91_01615, partial [Hadesarchaea archaeon]
MKEKGVTTAVMAAVIVVIVVVAGIGAYFMLKGPGPSTEVQVYKGIWMPGMLLIPDYLASNI